MSEEKETIQDNRLNDHWDNITELEKKLTWLSNENATLHTQVDDDALKRAENGQRIGHLFKTVHGIAPDEVDGLQERIKKLEARAGSARQTERDCKTCEHFGEKPPDTCYDCDGRYSKWEAEKEPTEDEIGEQWDRDQAVSKHWQQRIKNITKEFIADLKFINKTLEITKTINLYPYIEKWEGRSKK